MKKFLFIVTLLCLVVLVFTGCKTKIEKTSNSNLTVFDNFTVIERRTGDGKEMYIMYDNDTKVEYYYICTTFYNNERGGLCPVYNADGTVKVYSENSD